jgi:hypothetical protein
MDGIESGKFLKSRQVVRAEGELPYPMSPGVRQFMIYQMPK